MNRIHLKRLEIRELFDHSFNLLLENLSDGVTIVYGPNASGKSSLAAAASRVFCTRETLPTDLVRATVKFDTEDLEIELRGPKSANRAPQSSRPRLYLLSIPDLVTGPSGEDTQLISETLAGGLNLESCLPSKSPKVPALDAPKRVLDERRIRAGETAKHELSLVHLRTQRDEAESATRDYQVIARWIRACESDEAAGAAERQALDLTLSHPGLNLQGPTACEDVQEALAGLRSAEANFDAAESALDPFEGRMPACALAANDDETLRRLSDEAVARLENIRTVKLAVQKAKDGILAIELKLPPFGPSKLPVDPQVRQDVVALAKGIELAQEDVRAANAAVSALLSPYQQAEAALINAGGDTSSVHSVDRSPGKIEVASQLDDAVRQANELNERAKNDLAEATVALQQARAGLVQIKDSVTADDVMARITKDPPVSRLFDELRAARIERTAREKIASELEAWVSDQKLAAADAEAASRFLTEWLNAGQSVAPAKRPVALIATAAGFIIVVLGLGFGGSPIFGAVLGAVGLVVVAVLAWAGSPVVAVDDARREDVQRSIPGAWKPDRWTVSEAVVKLEQAITAARRVQATEDLFRRVEAVASGVETTEKESTLKARLDELKAETGLDFDYPADLALLVQKLAVLHSAILIESSKNSAAETAKSKLTESIDARKRFLQFCNASVATGAEFRALAAASERFLSAAAACESAQNALESAVERRDLALTEFHAFLTSFGWPANGDPATAAEQFVRWLDDSVALKALHEEHRSREDELVLLDREQQLCDQSLFELFERYGFSKPSVAGDGIRPFRNWFAVSEHVKGAQDTVRERLRSLSDRLTRNGVPEMDDLEARCRVPELREADREAFAGYTREAEEKRRDARMLRLPDDDAVAAKLGIDTSSGLDALHHVSARLERTASALNSLTERIHGIQTEIDLATKDLGLQAAQKNLDDAIAKSLDWLGIMAKSAANRAVLAAIEKATRDENTTPIIESANLWLARLTQGRYGSLAEDGKVVTVRDRDDGNRSQRTDQLSTGTKVHLAFAIRLAVIEQSETLRQRFPLFLDEVMATSDIDARTAMAVAIKEISAERQVILLTNQPDDVNLLKKVLGEDVLVAVLPKAEPIPVAPPAAPPEGEVRQTGVGLPLRDEVRRWRALLVKDLLESPVDSDRIRVDAVLSATASQRDLRVVGALEVVRREVASAYRPFEWQSLSGVDLGGQEMEDKVRDAWDQNRANPEAFIAAVHQIPRRRTAMLERLRERLELLGLIGGDGRPEEGRLIDIAESELPESLRGLAPEIVNVFRDYLAPGS